jgi:hypothetical protein
MYEMQKYGRWWLFVPGVAASGGLVRITGKVVMVMGGGGQWTWTGTGTEVTCVAYKLR